MPTLSAKSVTESLSELASKLAQILREKGLTLAVAESCTGGLLSATLTSLPGISDVFLGGFITYSNAMKTSLLGVQESTLRENGAVSASCCAEMVAGTLANSTADIAISITGIAGPGGASTDKPVGLVYIGIQQKGRQPRIDRHVFSGDREAVRTQAVIAALTAAISLLHQD